MEKNNDENKENTKEIRYVESFNPNKYLVEIPSKGNPEVSDLYLMVQWRKKWMLCLMHN